MVGTCGSPLIRGWTNVDPQYPLTRVPSGAGISAVWVMRFAGRARLPFVSDHHAPRRTSTTPRCLAKRSTSALLRAGTPKPRVRRKRDAGAHRAHRVRDRTRHVARLFAESDVAIERVMAGRVRLVIAHHA